MTSYIYFGGNSCWKLIVVPRKLPLKQTVMGGSFTVSFRDRGQLKRQEKTLGKNLICTSSVGARRSSVETSRSFVGVYGLSLLFRA